MVAVGLVLPCLSDHRFKRFAQCGPHRGLVRFRLAAGDSVYSVYDTVSQLGDGVSGPCLVTDITPIAPADLKADTVPICRGASGPSPDGNLLAHGKRAATAEELELNQTEPRQAGTGEGIRESTDAVRLRAALQF